MSLNIKNESTHAAVRELATLRGVSQTEAVDEAVRARLATIRAEHDKEARFDRIMAISRESAAAIRESGVDFSVDDLYDDELGLPK